MTSSVLRVPLVLLSLILGSLGIARQRPSEPLYKDPAASIPDRVRDLLGRMTLEEKVAQLESGVNKPSLAGMQNPSVFAGDHLNEELVKKMLAHGLGTYAFLTEFSGVASVPGEISVGAHRRNLLQAWVIRNTRLGIPILFHGEALHGAVVRGATSFPQAIGLGSTWDPELLQQMFTVVAREERTLGNLFVLAPVLDLSRDPRYGRVEEMYSEDPYLVAEMGVAAIRGLQGIGDHLDAYHVFATAKHFVHGQPENGTNTGPSDFSERTMRSIFLYPFERAVKDAHVEAVMPSYNETAGGIPSNANPWLLRHVLRAEWGFTGLTVSDYTAIEELATKHHVAQDIEGAAILAFKSGVDMELPEPSAYPTLIDAVQSGNLPEADVDEAVGRVLAAKFRAGLFEHPFVEETRTSAQIASVESSSLARRVADEAIVLLKNDGKALPLDENRIRTLAVIGPNGNKMRLGTYSGVPAHYATILDGIQKRVGSRTRVVFAEGCRITEPDTAPTLNAFVPYEPPKEETDRKLMDEAVEAAKSTDVIVLALGGNEAVSRESFGEISPGKFSFGDSDTLDLPGRQNELVDRIASLHKPIIAVLLGGKPYSIEHLAKQVPAIAEGWYLGQETGDAIAGVLFGDVNPSGHLPITMARNVGQLPVYYYRTPAARRGYVFDGNTPLYPFGFGLSYTTFSFGKLAANRQTISASESAEISVDVTNTGLRAGDEVVQMYIHHPVSSVVQPVIALRGFQRIHLEQGQSKKVIFKVGPEQLSILDAEMKRIVEPGPVDVLIGSDSTRTSAIQINITSARGPTGAR